MRGSDIVARLSGGEFVVVLPDAGNAAAVARITENILFALRAIFHCQEKSLHVTASIGVACYPEEGCENEVLIRHADTAMYHVKGTGRNSVQFFAEEMNASAAERLRWQSDLQQGLASGQFVLHYQSQLRISDFSITGAEALVRWNHPRDGLVLPELRKLGTRLAIDDFGTGYSSLSYLNVLPIQCLELDKAFLQDVERDKNNASIRTATIALAHSLGLHVVGEGAETEAQYRFLARYDCDIVQGHFLSKPMPADQAFSFISGRGRMPDFSVMLERSIGRLSPKSHSH